jgi:uncharacterized membrane protein
MQREELSLRVAGWLSVYAEKLGGWVYGFVRRHWLGIVNFHLLIFLAGALEAPLLPYLDPPWISKVVYRAYGFFCHQEPSRCFFLFGNQMAICSRCVAFYSAILVVGLLLSLRDLRPLRVHSAFALAFPAMADVSLQAVHLTESTNLIRTITGLLLGTAVSLYLLPRAKNAVNRLEPDDTEARRKTGLSRNNQARGRDLCNLASKN